MTIEQIIELAEKENPLTKSELEKKLTELKSLNFRLLECILYVRVTQNCSLLEAKTLVVNSNAWIDTKDDFLSHQQEQMEAFFEAVKKDIS